MSEEPFADLRSGAIVGFHDDAVRTTGWSALSPNESRRGAWAWIEADHRYNCLLWDEEDLARRRNIPDAEIVGNKRAIDRCNQLRNDAIERIDEALLASLSGVTPTSEAWHNSETAGAMIDRLSILALKVHHMGLAAATSGASDAHRGLCAEKHARLVLQRIDLAHCFDTLLAKAAKGEAFWRIYRQFKMYNDPALNPWLRGGEPAAG